MKKECLCILYLQTYYLKQKKNITKTTIGVDMSATTFCFNGFLPLSFMDIQSTSHITLPGHIFL